MIDISDIKDIIFRVDVKVKVLSAFIILIAIPYLIYNFSIVPLLEQQERLALDLSAQQNLLETRKANVTNIEELEAKLKKTKSELEKMEKKFLKEENLPTFFTELRQLAAGNRVEIVNLKFAQKAKAEKNEKNKPEQEQEKNGKAAQTYEGLPVRLALTGDYLDVILLISQIRKESALFSIDAMVMYGKNKPDEPLTVELQLVFYIIQEEKEDDKRKKTKIY